MKKQNRLLNIFSVLPIVILFLTSCVPQQQNTGNLKSSQDLVAQNQDLQFEFDKRYDPKSLKRFAVLPVDNTFMNSRTLDQALLNQLATQTRFEIDNIQSPLIVQEKYKTLPAKRSEAVKDRGYLFGTVLGDTPAVLAVEISTDNNNDLQGRSADAKVSVRFWIIEMRTGDVLVAATYYNRNNVLSDNLKTAQKNLHSNFGVMSRFELINRAFGLFAVRLEKYRIGKN